MPLLSVTLLRASNLPASDYSFQGGKSDPYVRFMLSDQELQSSCIKNALNPEWQPPETFEFEVEDQATEVLRIEVYDADNWNADDLLGSLAIPVAKFAADGADQTTNEVFALELAPAFASKDLEPSIHLEVLYAPAANAEKVLTLWENEKYTPLSGWHPADSADRRQWSSYDDKITSNRFEDVAPTVPAHLEGKGWGYSAQRGDAQGWLYAVSATGPWAASSNSLTYVRRRLWENRCTVSESEENECRPSF